MAAKATRQEARARLTKAFMKSLDQVIPEDESVPLKGRSFRDFELQAQRLKEAVIPTLLEERAALDEGASAQEAGTCPHCGGGRTYLEAGAFPKEIRSPDGPVVLEKQRARCRQCDGSFSPSGSRVVVAGGAAAESFGG